MIPTVQNPQASFYIQQIYTPSLALLSYYVESEGEAIIIDPIRDPAYYLQLATTRNSKIIFIFVTHYHTDFVSGHFELNERTNAPIIFGPHEHQLDESSKITIAYHEQQFKLGHIDIKVLHTPGHTLESSSFLLLTEDKPYCVFSGDTIFLGDCGRPDLTVCSKYSREQLAEKLFYSLRNSIMTLPEETIIYPGHGAGSLCGKNIQCGTFCTLGNQLKTNYSIRKDMTKEEFITILTANIPTPPSYFFVDSKMNSHGYKLLDDVFADCLKHLSPDDFETISIKDKCTIIDTRKQHEYFNGYIDGSYNFNHNTLIAVWLAFLIQPGNPLLFVISKGTAREVLNKFFDCGFENIKGFLTFDEWVHAKKPYKTIEEAKAENIQNVKDAFIIDCRQPHEYKEGHFKDTVFLPLFTLQQTLESKEICSKESQNIYVYCRSGTRSCAAISILHKNGYSNCKNIAGGYSKMKESSFIPITE